MKAMNKEELDSYFALNKESYHNDFLSVYLQNGVRPKFLIQFPVVLPFEFPFGNGACITFSLKKGDFCTFHFSNVNSTDHVSAGIVGPNPISVPITKTRVEMTLSTNENIGESIDDKFISDCFSQLVEYLNRILVSYQIYKKDTDVYQVSREMFEFGCIYRVIETERWDDFRSGLFLMHWNVPYKKEKLSNDERDEILRYVSIIDGEKNPFILSEEIMLDAHRYYKSGFYKEAIIYCQSSIETFLSTLFSKMLMLEGKEDEEVQDILESTPFIGMVKREFHSRLGGNWNPQNTASVIGRWYKDLYSLRNRVVHSGYKPDYEKASKALQLAIEFRRKVIELVYLNEKKYPELVQYFFLEE